MKGLSLTRKLGQKIMIGDDVVITITQLSSGNCKLNFIAPANVKILREEVYIREQQRAICDSDEDRAAHHALTGE